MRSVWFDDEAFTQRGQEILDVLGVQGDLQPVAYGSDQAIFEAHAVAEAVAQKLRHRPALICFCNEHQIERRDDFQTPLLTGFAAGAFQEFQPCHGRNGKIRLCCIPCLG